MRNVIQYSVPPSTADVYTVPPGVLFAVCRDFSLVAGLLDFESRTSNIIARAGVADRQFLADHQFVHYIKQESM